MYVYKLTLNCNISQSYCFYFIFDQINAALLSTIYLFRKHFQNRINPKLLNSSTAFLKHQKYRNNWLKDQTQLNVMLNAIWMQEWLLLDKYWNIIVF